MQGLNFTSTNLVCQLILSRLTVKFVNFVNQYVEEFMVVENAKGWGNGGTMAKRECAHK
jgi:hypothetical protein